VLNRKIPNTGQRQDALMRRLQNKNPANKAKYHAKKHDSRNDRRAGLERGVK
jgi:hypothetical protein